MACETANFFKESFSRTNSRYSPISISLAKMEGLGHRYHATSSYELAHGAESLSTGAQDRLGQELLGVDRTLLGDTHVAIHVSVGSIG